MSPVFSILIVFNEQNLGIKSPPAILNIYIYMKMELLCSVLYCRRSWLRPKTELRHRDTVYFGLRTVLNA